ncbi:sugar-phosphatase [Catalinimonas alkaloidigena]|uniref:Sugar-phosphatase n=1 Tax=Catalinimonas alkaloidigena TaxID=1075417 RepID=A0A1G9APC1_9BACT|nr:hexitol phosphatase HxpB [Catalinimonas alkaloidigena]SDK29127.1 sugar-phosphatase [Catalinimonas alkaloidigena]
MIKGIIFDMDGLLVDSEPLWRKAEVAIFNPLGVPLTEEMCIQTMGLRIDEVVTYWHARYPWESPSKEAVVEQIVAAVEALMLAEGKPMPGVQAIIDLFRKKGLHLAVASSSYKRLIYACLRAFELEDYFTVIHSAEDEPFGKPHPGIYLTALKKLGLAAHECLALEDSPNGMLAAVAAGIPTIVVPEASTFDDPRFEKATLKLSSLEDFTEHHFQTLSNRS